jgi:hypothetical protein
MPSARKVAVTASPIPGSSRKNSVWRASTVTLLPSRAKACASSSATADEPITARRGGMTALANASVEVQYDVSLSPGIGGIDGCAPVAIRQRSNASSRSPPSWSRTTRCQLSLKHASPRSTVTAGVLSRMPSYFACRSSSTRERCCASRRAPLMTGVLAAIPPSKGLSRRRCATCAARIMIFDGTQPTLTQVPPIVPRSMSVTRAPRSAAFSAAAIAAPPLPMTATCNASSPPGAFWPPPSQLRALPSRLSRGRSAFPFATRAR